ncbi:MAG: hypothetical protein ACFFFC_00315 [Candidatus Thorarchaeota archaeon]
MQKISANKVATILSTVPTMLRQLASERDTLMEKVAQLQSNLADYERRDRVAGLAKKAHEKHLDSLGGTEEEKIASIEDALQRGRTLDVMEEAVKMSSPAGDLAYLVDNELYRGEGTSGNSDLEQYLLNGI